MPGIYSISKINCFGNCRLQYKYHYIDKIEAEIEGIEAFMGKMVHEALEELYMAVKNRVVRPLDWVLKKYKELWDKNAHDSLKIVKSEYTINDYYMKGRKILEEYYLEYQPFDRTKVVSTEQNMNFSIKDGKHELRGVLDRLDWNDKENIYEIHDYKTSATLPTQEDADKDEQLGLYHIALKQYWKETDRVKLVWHYLLFNKEMISYKSDAELLDLENSIARKIEEIEACSEYPPRKSGLCPYCGYQDICPLWKHPNAMRKTSVNEYKQNTGVQLVAKYAELEEAKDNLLKKVKDIEIEQGKIVDAAIEYADREGIQVIDGPERQLKISIEKETRTPTKMEDPLKWQEVRDFLIKENKLIEVSTINANMLRSRMRVWPKDLVSKVSKYVIEKVTRKISLVRKY